MNATSIGRSLSITLVAASLMACAVSSEREDTGQANEELKCRTCGAPDPEPKEPVVDPGPRQGPSMSCNGKYQREINGLCYQISFDCPDPDGHCGGYTVVGRYYCPVAYPVQRCNGFGTCTCWTE
jgi:hypothetical protein